ncbi:hypothetical protein [Streptomyces sp. KLOTTS4A1]|uniref:hypothetical protein n=1 Tax=Streptomyces sp. KLOTTS4A1 TaxID=3390996 RepID=UPI0039F5D07C
MICCRCDKPILPGQKSRQVTKFSASGGGITLHEHKACPPDGLTLRNAKRRR